MPDLVDLHRLMKKFQNSEPVQMGEIWGSLDVVADDEFCLTNQGIPVEVRSQVEHYRIMTPFERCRKFLEAYVQCVTREGTTDGSNPRSLVYQNILHEIQNSPGAHSNYSIEVWRAVLEEFRQSQGCSSNNT